MPLKGGPGRIRAVFGVSESYVAMFCIPESPYQNVSFIVFRIKELGVTEFQTSTHDCYVLLMCLFPGNLNASFGSPWGFIVWQPVKNHQTWQLEITHLYMMIPLKPSFTRGCGPWPRCRICQFEATSMSALPRLMKELNTLRMRRLQADTDTLRFHHGRETSFKWSL
jgi:hypothetical protein